VTRALMAGQFVLAGIILIKAIVPLAIDYLVRWVTGRLPGRKPEVQDLQKIVDALHDLALQEKTISFGDNASLHTKAEVLMF
jgi:hypothetical protein